MALVGHAGVSTEEQQQELQTLPRSEQAELVHHHDGASVRYERTRLRTLQEDAQRAESPAGDPRVRQVVDLPPS